MDPPFALAGHGRLAGLEATELPLSEVVLLLEFRLSACLDHALAECRLRAFTGWGLRPVEACELHADQLVLAPEDGDVPYIEFAAGEREGWTGHLFPGQSAGTPMSTDTARRWLRDPGERADVPSPEATRCQRNRRKWYRLYRQQRPDLEAGTVTVAAAQGATTSASLNATTSTRRPAGAPCADAMRTLVLEEFVDLFEQYL